MTYEKIAKAALLRSEQWSPERVQQNHRGASHMMTLLLWPRYLSKLAFKRPVVEFIIKPRVDELENLHPANSLAGPWLEYPWLTGTNTVGVPCQDPVLLDAYRSTSNQAALLARFAASLIVHHHRIFT